MAYTKLAIPGFTLVLQLCLELNVVTVFWIYVDPCGN